MQRHMNGDTLNPAVSREVTCTVERDKEEFLNSFMLYKKLRPHSSLESEKNSQNLEKKADSNVSGVVQDVQGNPEIEPVIIPTNTESEKLNNTNEANSDVVTGKENHTVGGEDEPNRGPLSKEKGSTVEMKTENISPAILKRKKTVKKEHVYVQKERAVKRKHEDGEETSSNTKFHKSEQESSQSEQKSGGRVWMRPLSDLIKALEASILEESKIEAQGQNMFIPELSYRFAQRAPEVKEVDQVGHSSSMVTHKNPSISSVASTSSHSPDKVQSSVEDRRTQAVVDQSVHPNIVRPSNQSQDISPNIAVDQKNRDDNKPSTSGVGKKKQNCIPAVVAKTDYNRRPPHRIVIRKRTPKVAAVAAVEQISSKPTRNLRNKNKKRASEAAKENRISYNPNMVRRFVTQNRTPAEKQKRKENNIASKKSRMLANKNAEIVCKALDETEKLVKSYEKQFNNTVAAYVQIRNFFQDFEYEDEDKLVAFLGKWDYSLPRLFD